MNSWKTLNKYKSTHRLPDNDDFLHYIDLIFWYHKKHIKLRKLLRKMEFEYGFTNKLLYDRLKKSNFVKKQRDINLYIRSYFILIIIELAKLIEGNKDFKEYLNSNILVGTYERFYRRDEKNNEDVVKEIKTISQKIAHFRDACVHNEDFGISDYPIQIESNSNSLKIDGYNVYQCKNKTYVEGNGIHLEFIVEGPNQIWCFVIGYGKMSFEEFEKIIRYTLDYFYK